MEMANFFRGFQRFAGALWYNVPLHHILFITPDSTFFFAFRCAVVRYEHNKRWMWSVGLAFLGQYTRAAEWQLIVRLYRGN